jgi:prepilin-type processing-associated H-X9-DG protein
LSILPPGAVKHQKGGISYLTQIVPYIEQSNTVALLDEYKNSWHHANMSEANSLKIPLFHCPSFDNPVDGTSYGGMDYYGIMGAKTGHCPDPNGEYAIVKLLGRPTCRPHGAMPINGCLYVDSAIRIADIRDGTSNTLLVGEQSRDVCQWHPWTAGMGNGLVTIYSARSITYPINSRSATYMHSARCDGIAGYHDTALGSQHPGGAHFCFADGSVSFIQENIHIDLYRHLASRSNGEVAVLPR